MKGTEKQILWAEDIKRETLETCDANIRLSQARLDEYKADMFKLDEIAYRLVKAAFVKMFAGIDDAGAIINRRHRMGGSGVNSLADQIRNDLVKGKSADEIAALLHVTNY